MIDSVNECMVNLSRIVKQFHRRNGTISECDCSTRINASQPKKNKIKI